MKLTKSEKQEFYDYLLKLGTPDLLAALMVKRTTVTKEYFMGVMSRLDAKSQFTFIAVFTLMLGDWVPESEFWAGLFDEFRVN